MMYPATCEPPALAVIVDEVRATCNRPTAAFFLACLVLRALWLVAERQPHRLAGGSRAIQRATADWWV
jgi:hypothetical protein